MFSLKQLNKHFILDERTYVHLIKFVQNMKNEIFGSNYPYIDYFCQKDALQKVHTINNLSLFLKNYVLVSQFSGIHSSLETYNYYVHVCAHV